MSWFRDGTKLLVSGHAHVGAGKPATWSVSTVTGSLRMLREGAWSPAVSPDDSRIAFGNTSGTEIWLMGANGEDAHRVLTLEKGYLFNRLEWSPNGQLLAFLEGNREFDQVSIVTLDPATGQTMAVFSDPRLKDFCWVPDARMLFSLSELPPNEKDYNLWEIRTDLRTGKAASEPRRITHLAGFSPQGLSLTADGKRLAFTNRRAQSDVYVGELEAKGMRLNSPRRLTLDDRIDWPGGWTRDSKAILFFSDRKGQFDIFRQGVADREAELVVAGPEEKRAPQLSPDGSWILYLAWDRTKSGVSRDSGRLMRVPAAGGPPETVFKVNGYPGIGQLLWGRWALSSSKGHPEFRCPSTRAAPCVVAELVQDQLIFTAFDPVRGRKGEVAKIEADPNFPAFWDLSPDGTRIAVGKDVIMSGPLSILPVSGGPAREVSVNGWGRLDSLAWSADGTSLFATSWSPDGSSLLRVNLSGEARLLWRETTWFERLLPSPDGRRLALGYVTAESNVWMIENFQ